MALMPVPRGVTCVYCEHNTRLFSPRCGACGRQKLGVQRLPIYGLRLVLAALALAAAIGLLRLRH